MHEISSCLPRRSSSEGGRRQACRLRTLHQRQYVTLTAFAVFPGHNANHNVRGDATLLPCTNMQQLVFGLVLGLASSAFGQAVADRVAKQNALFEAYYQAGLKGLRIFRSGQHRTAITVTTHSLDRFRSRKSPGNMRKPMTFSLD